MAPIAKHLETDMENVHSLPNLEEARTQNIISSGGNKYSGKKKRTIALIVVLVAVIATAVGFSVAVAGNKRGEKEANALANNENGGDNDDGNGGNGDDENAAGDDGADLSDDQETDDDERFKQVITFLTNSGITSATDLQNIASPQYKAAAWMSNDDERELDIPEELEEEDSYKFVQRYVMAVFYYALGGSGWTRLAEDSFLTADDVCDWNFGLSVFRDADQTDEYDYGVSCWDDDADDYDDTVTWIFMPDNNLVGSLPSEIGALQYLNHISLYNNKISGPIPDTFQQLDSLNYWAMESNDISGSLPSWINTLESLEYLALGDNSLTGELPSFVGSNLIELSLDINQLDGSIDNLNDATSLVNVYLNNNTFSGKLTDDTLRDLINNDLAILDLSSNRLTGSFPAYFYWLEEIDLSHNELDGTIAAPIDDDDEEEDLPVTKINLSENRLTGSIPTNIDILVSLVSLDLSDNDLSGSMPSQLGNLEMLESLYLSQNTRLTGTIPDLRGCESLTEVSMASTGRTGIIPDWFGTMLQDLQLLDLHSNQLEKTIPTNLGLLEDLSVLMLNRNQLTGDVPSQLGDLQLLDFLFLDNNNLEGSMQPICEGEAEDILYLYVDTTVKACDDGCCSAYCSDDSCNRPDDTVKKLDDNFISRDAYVYGEAFKLSEVDSPEN